MGKRSFILTIVAATCVGLAASATGETVSHYTDQAIEEFTSTGTLAGLTQAYQTLDTGMKDTTVTGDKRPLVLLHVLASTGMLVYDTGNVAVDTSLLEVGQPLGFAITGHKFFSLDPEDPDRIQPVLPTDPEHPDCLKFPPGADINAAAAAINDDVLPELNAIIAELNGVSNWSSFTMTLTPEQTGLAADVEVDYSDVLALKAGLLSLKALLYTVANVPCNLQVDLANPIFTGWECGLLPDTTTVNTILNEYPHLLEILAGTGTTKLSHIKDYLLDAIDAAKAAIQSVLDETDDQATDLLQIDEEDRAQNVALIAELTKFRNSLAHGTAATYTLGSYQEFDLRQGGDVIGQLTLKFGPPVSEPDNGWFVLSDPVDMPGGWAIDWFDINGTQIMGEAEASGGWYEGWFQGTISANGSQITNMTFNWWTWDDGQTITGLSALRTLNDALDMRFNPGPIFSGAVSLRDILPQFGPNGEGIPTTMGHGLNNDATLGGIFPGMTQQDWIPYGYEVWGGNTNYIDDAPWWSIFRNISRYGYTKLGESTGANLTVSGNYHYYAIVARGETLIDSIRGSTGAYLAGEPLIVDVENGGNLTGTPDSQYAAVGHTDFFDPGSDQFSGFVVVTNPGGAEVWSGLTVITGGAVPVVTATASPTEVVANGTAASTITITVKDSFGAAMPDVPAASIVVSATGAGHTITQPTAATNASGRTTATIRSTEADPSKRINVTLDGVAFNEVATVAFTAGAAKTLAFVAQPVGPYAAGATINAIPKVAVQDAQGNTITTSTAQITIAIGNNPGGGTLSGTNKHAAESGEATFSGLSIDKAGTGYTLRATASGLTAAESNPFNVIPDAATARLVFLTSPGSSPALGALNPAPQVAVKDALGNTVTTINPDVTLAIKAGTGDDGATLIGTNPVAAVSGVATFNDVKINRAGTAYQLTATAPGVTGTPESLAFNVTAEPAMTVEKHHDADPVDPGDDVTYTITYGNDGLADAHNVVIQETLPAGMTFVSATDGGIHSGGVITWNIGDVAADAEGLTVGFVAHITDALGDGGTVTNRDLTIVCDGGQPVPQVTPDVTHVRDKKKPEVSGQVPAPESIQAALGPMIRLHVTDAGSGVKYDGGSVKIYIEEDIVYDGSAENPEGKYDSTGSDQAVRGICRRTGTGADYTFTFVPTTRFRHEQKVDVTVEVMDVAENAGTIPYFFYTAKRTFGENAKVNSDTGSAIQDNPAVATDPDGNIWAVWDQRATPAGDTNIYIGEMAADGDAFGASVTIYDNAEYQSNPAIAADQNGKLYVVWEQWTVPGASRRIMMANSDDWDTAVQVNPDPASAQSVLVARNPSIAVNATNEVFIAWEQTVDGGNSDIWLRSFTAGGFADAIQITTDTANQTEPVVGIGPGDVVYVTWTDARASATTGTDIYRARSDVGPWTNNPVIQTAGDQTSPAGAMADEVHLAWVDGPDLKYTYEGMETPISVLDPGEAGALPAMPALAATAADPHDRAYACWVDSRNIVHSNGDTDIYFAENGSAFGTNLRVNDDAGGHRQTKPAIGVNAAGEPYMVWVDNRDGNDDIYYAGSTALKPPQSTTAVPGEGKVTVQSDAEENLHVEVPTNALPEGVEPEDITITEVTNPPEPPTGGFGVPYDFGPSGVVFPNPVTIRIPLADGAPGGRVWVYFYDAGTGKWSADGVHNPATVDPGGSYLEVLVDHFTTFMPGRARASTDHGGGGGGGGCALSPWSNAGPIEVILPFAVLVLALLACGIVGQLRRHSGGTRE